MIESWDVSGHSKMIPEWRWRVFCYSQPLARKIHDWIINKEIEQVSNWFLAKFPENCQKHRDGIGKLPFPIPTQTEVLIKIRLFRDAVTQSFHHCKLTTRVTSCDKHYCIHKPSRLSIASDRQPWRRFVINCFKALAQKIFRVFAVRC